FPIGLVKAGVRLFCVHAPSARHRLAKTAKAPAVIRSRINLSKVLLRCPRSGLPLWAKLFAQCNPGCDGDHKKARCARRRFPIVVRPPRWVPFSKRQSPWVNRNCGHWRPRLKSGQWSHLSLRVMAVTRVAVDEQVAAAIGNRCEPVS